MKKKILAFIGIGLINAGCALGMTLSSAAFPAGAEIPKIYSCDGENIAPNLAWSAIPAGTKSLALILDDPDAAAGIWTHWVVFNVPATVTQLTSSTLIPGGSQMGSNSWGKMKYNGPCPPYDETHRYHFKLYALDTLLRLPGGANATEVMRAAEHHILGQVELTGKYERSHSQ